MSFHDVAKAVRAEASHHGLTATMSRVNDAIALACYGKKYAAVIAAEKAGKLGPIPTPPPNITSVARRYGIDEYGFGLSLRDGIEGRPAAEENQAVNIAMNWLIANHVAELRRLEQEEMLSLVPDGVYDRVFGVPGYQMQAVFAFSEWLIAEGAIQVNGRLQKVADMLLRGTGRPAWNARERAYLTALTTAPLRLYAVEEVSAGYHLTLRPTDVAGQGLVRVSERKASTPDMVGQTIAARVITRHGRLELAGAVLSFASASQTRVAEAVRKVTGAQAVSRTLRAAWFEQFAHPLPKVVLSETGEELLLVSDHYCCTLLSQLADLLATDPRVEGSEDLGWTLVVEGADGRIRPMCWIHPDDEAPGSVVVVYESEGRAAAYRPWFEALVAGTATFNHRTTADPVAAASDPARQEKRRRNPLPANLASEALNLAYHEMYANFADKPLPLFEGATPREMMRRPGGEQRVRELLGMYERNERRMAQEDWRDPVPLGFLYEKLGLAPTVESVQTRASGLHPSQFQVNEAWVAFKLYDEPVAVKDHGDMLAIGLMDAASTCILNIAFVRADAALSEVEAQGFLEKSRFVSPPPRPPRHLFIGSDIGATVLSAVAKRRGIMITTMDPLELEGIVGSAREGIGDRLDAIMGGHAEG